MKLIYFLALVGIGFPTVAGRPKGDELKLRASDSPIHYTALASEDVLRRIPSEELYKLAKENEKQERRKAAALKKAEEETEKEENRLAKAAERVEDERKVAAEKAQEELETANKKADGDKEKAAERAEVKKAQAEKKASAARAKIFAQATSKDKRDGIQLATASPSWETYVVQHRDSIPPNVTFHVVIKHQALSLTPPPTPKEVEKRKKLEAAKAAADRKAMLDANARKVLEEAQQQVNQQKIDKLKSDIDAQRHKLIMDAAESKIAQLKKDEKWRDHEFKAKQYIQEAILTPMPLGAGDSVRMRNKAAKMAKTTVPKNSVAKAQATTTIAKMIAEERVKQAKSLEEHWATARKRSPQEQSAQQELDPKAKAEVNRWANKHMRKQEVMKNLYDLATLSVPERNLPVTFSHPAVTYPARNPSTPLLTVTTTVAVVIPYPPATTSEPTTTTTTTTESVPILHKRKFSDENSIKGWERRKKLAMAENEKWEKVISDKKQADADAKRAASDAKKEEAQKLKDAANASKQAVQKSKSIEASKVKEASINAWLATVAPETAEKWRTEQAAAQAKKQQKLEAQAAKKAVEDAKKAAQYSKEWDAAVKQNAEINAAKAAKESKAAVQDAAKAAKEADELATMDAERAAKWRSQVSERAAKSKSYADEFEGMWSVKSAYLDAVKSKALKETKRVKNFEITHSVVREVASKTVMSTSTVASTTFSTSIITNPPIAEQVVGGVVELHEENAPSIEDCLVARCEYSDPPPPPYDHSVAAEQYAAWFSWLKTQTTMSLPWTTQTAAPTLLVARADPPPPPYNHNEAAEKYAVWFSWLQTQTMKSLPWNTETATPTLLVARGEVSDPPPPPFDHNEAAEKYAVWFSWLQTQTAMSLPWTGLIESETVTATKSLVARDEPSDPPPPPYDHTEAAEKYAMWFSWLQTQTTKSLPWTVLIERETVTSTMVTTSTEERRDFETLPTPPPYDHTEAAEKYAVWFSWLQTQTIKSLPWTTATTPTLMPRAVETIKATVRTPNWTRKYSHHLNEQSVYALTQTTVNITSLLEPHMPSTLSTTTRSVTALENVNAMLRQAQTQTTVNITNLLEA